MPPIHFPGTARSDLLPGIGRGDPPIVGVLRAEAGRSPYDRQLTVWSGNSPPEAICSGALGSPRRREHRTGLNRPPPVVSDLDLTFRAMDLASDRRLQMMSSPPKLDPSPRTPPAIADLAETAIPTAAV